MSTAFSIEVSGLGKRYVLGEHTRFETLRDTLVAGWRRLRGAPRGDDKDILWALRDVSFRVAPGEAVGVIGRNGSGKSTLLKILARIIDPTEGRAVIRGRVAALLEVGVGFHPELTGRENVFLNGALFGLTRHEVAARFDEIAAFAEVDRFLDTPVKRYSSGMRVRLAFAVAAHLDPEILLIDEVLAVGDYGFQQKSLRKMKEVLAGGRTVLFVSHNHNAVQDLCTRTVWLRDGRVEAEGPSAEVVARYLASMGEGVR